jgi:iron complex transport system ATP-binding protein
MRELRTRIAFVSAAVARTLRPGIGALDAVLTGCHAALEAWWHLYTDAERQRAEDLLADAGFAGGHFAQRQFGLLSEGERQQVLLARALMSSPELILMDEPAAGLDLGAREQLLTRLAAIAADPASPAFVLVTHHLEELPVGMTHAVLLRKGSVLAAGAIDEVLTSQAVSAVFATQVVVQHLGGRWTARAIA